MTLLRAVSPLALSVLLSLPVAPQEAPPSPAASAASAASAEADDAAAATPVRRTGEWNLGGERLALAGFDPVAYFPEGGGEAREGSREVSLEHHGAVYRFASAAHRERFLAAPARYEPAYGGWCAWAMAQEQGEKVEVDPESFLVQDGRLLLFYDGFFADTRKRWQKGDEGALASRADANWKRMAGEEPRRVAAPLAPAFELRDPEGRVHQLADLRGRVVVLDFWATWCGPCRTAMPGVQALHERFADRPVSIYGVNVAEHSPDADPAGYMREQGYTYTMLHGTDDVAQAYDVTALPTFVLIGPDGRERLRHVGGAADLEERLTSAIEAALPPR